MTLWAIICSDCGRPDNISFEPTPGRNIYCGRCNAARKGLSQPKHRGGETQPPKWNPAKGDYFTTYQRAKRNRGYK
jgi:CxxC-x17-CxxC domain-containing protein